jgi:hypothetical protein
MRAHPLEEIV